jgi:dTDP-4-dehydrorhamnose reductase
MKYQRVLITGCGGMLGNAIYPYFRERFPNVLATDRQVEPDERDWLKYLDCQDEGAMAKTFDEFKPDLVLHLAALTDVEICEEHPEEARIENTIMPQTAADLARKHDATLVYVSTGGIFDGLKGDFYTEQDEPHPINMHGVTKLGGEHEVRAIHPKHFILRPGWMIGGGPKNEHKFVWYICGQLAGRARVLHGVTDKVGTPTYTHDFAMNLFSLLDTDAYGTYHMVCRGHGTRYDVAKEIVKICGLEDEVEVKAVDSSFFETQFWGKRPDCEMLACKGLESLGIYKMRDWRVALAEYLNKEYSGLIKKPTQAAVIRAAAAAE